MNLQQFLIQTRPYEKHLDILKKQYCKAIKENNNEAIKYWLNELELLNTRLIQENKKSIGGAFI